MEKIIITLPDGTEKEYDAGVTPLDVANDISKGLGRAAVAAKVNGKSVDLYYEIEEDSKVEIITLRDEEGIDIFRHSSAHIMAQAIKNLWPDAKLAIGPSIKDGFYYDIDMEHRLTPEDLELIEKEMKKIIKSRITFERHEVSKEEAIELFKKLGEEYKVELIENLPEDATISYYDQGEDFIDLCAGPHIPDSKIVKAYKLMNIAGAYWRGDENNAMLQRVYGTSWPKKSELDEYLERLEEAKKRDHRKLGKELDLFSFNNEIAPGFPFFHGKGMILRNELLNFWRDVHDRYGYQEINTPLIMDRKLWEQSGHWENYRENMYFTEIDDRPFAIKPMNCPGGIQVYKNSMHSYRDLPLRMSELGLVHRHELSGALHGLMRVRAFTQDDAHLYMLPEQMEQELTKVIELVDEIYQVFEFKYHLELSTKPENAMGDDETWDYATATLKKVLDKLGVDYTINEGDGAFYGPKIDFHLEDSIGRTWQCATIQLDMLMPERFELEYVGEDGQKHRPVMIHRTALGSIERFIGILVEHYAGAFPTWLAPVQVQIIPVTDRNNAYSQKIAKEIAKNDIRVEVDSRSEKVGFKIREAQLAKVPFMLIIGDNEEEAGNVSVRLRTDGDIGSKELEELIELVRKDIDEKINER
ncbi:MAG: threonine--tRNA ligase [Clostridia bacterium]